MASGFPAYPQSMSRGRAGRRPHGNRGGRGGARETTRDDVRQEEYRIKRNKEDADKIADAIAKLKCGGLARVIKESRPEQSETSVQAVILPISTRAIGIAVAKTESAVRTSMRPVEPINFYSVYRASLMQLDIKLYNTRKDSKYAPVTNNLFYETDIPFDYQQLAKTTTENVTPIANVINSIGNFEYKSEHFTCREPNLIRDAAGFQLPTAANVTINNLRATVEYLSNPNTDQNVRMDFFSCNSLFGSTWEGAPHNPVLTNPDMIMPAIYDEQEFRDDFSELHRMLDLLRKKKPDLMRNSIIDMSSGGCPSLLLSNVCAGLSLKPRVLGPDNF